MRPTVDRMHAALHELGTRTDGRRRPKAFYLGPADWDEFRAAGTWPLVETTFGNNPPVIRSEPAFHGVPVRPSKNVAPRNSKLYDHTGTGRMLPE